MNSIIRHQIVKRVGVVSSHPIQYHAPWFRELAQQAEVKVWFAFQPNAAQQGEGFGRPFTWDVDLLSGYEHEFLLNEAKRPGTDHFRGCDTPEIGKRLREENYDTVILCGWHLKSFLQAWWACRNLGVPVLVRGDSQLATPRSRLKKWIKEPLYRWFLSRFDGFLSVGKRNQAYLRHYGVPKKKIFFTPHFVDNEWFAKKSLEAKKAILELRRKWQAADDDLLIVFVGKLISKKRPEDIILAVKNLPSEVSARLVLIGSGEMEERLRKEAEKAKTDVVFAGFKNQSELPACYAAADVMVLPSDGGETWGLVVNEAMACGTPVIVSEACGCAPDLIDEGETGFTFPTGDTAVLTKRLQEMWRRKQAGHDWRPALRRKLQRYSVEACVEGTLKAVRAVAADDAKE